MVGRVISVGDIMVDVIIFSQVYPMVGGDSYVRNVLIDQGGSAANFASAIARLGIGVSIVGKVGSDWFGKFLVSRLKRFNVDVSNVIFSKGRTGVVFTIVDGNGERTMLSYRGVNVRLRPDEVSEECIGSAELLYVSGYSLIKRPQSDAVMKCIELAKKNNMLISFDPGQLISLVKPSIIRRVLRDVNIIMPNASELRFLSEGENLLERVKSLVSAGVNIVGLKLGEKGCLISDGRKFVNVSAFNVRPVNVTGAGDVWNAAFIYSLLNGFDMEYAGRFSNAAAALFISRLRKRFPTRREIEKFLVSK